MGQHIPLRMHIEYFRYVIRHKWFVFLGCWRLGLPWRGINHDWTKFLPCEWLPYVWKFDMPEQPSVYSLHGDVRLHATSGRRKFKEDVDRDFDRAWLHHQHTNKHHWQHWVLRNDNGDTRLLEMPDTYRREMVADWRGAGRALGFPDTRGWYLKNRENILLHPDTRAWVEQELGVAIRLGDTTYALTAVD